MNHSLRRTIGAGAAALILLVAGAHVAGVAAQNTGKAHQGRANGKTPPAPPRAAAAQPQKLPPRTPFTAADAAVAGVPGMPDARFWADSETDFEKASIRVQGTRISAPLITPLFPPLKLRGD